MKTGPAARSAERDAPRDRDGRVRGIAMVLGGSVGYALLPPLAKIAYDHGADASGLLALRFAIAAPLLVVLAIAQRPGGLSWGALRVAAVPATLFFLSTWTFFESLGRMSAVIATVVVLSYPIMVAVGGALVLGERLTRTRAALVSIGSLGVVLSAGISGRASVSGLVLASLSTVLFSCFFVRMKQVMAQGRVDGLTLTACVSLLAGAGYVLLFAVQGGSLPADTAGYAATLGIAIFATVVAAALLYSGLHHLDAGTAAMLGAVELPLAVVLTATLLAEPIAPLQVVGMAVVLVTVGGLSYDATQPAQGIPPGP